MTELFDRTGDPEMDDALALLERAHSCIDRAAGHFEEVRRVDVLEILNTALNALVRADEQIR